MSGRTGKEDTFNFHYELLTAARKYIDRSAVYHQNFAGNCIEFSRDHCLDDGIGPKRFDCSGFVLRAYCDVTGRDVHELADIRHARDMWQAAASGSEHVSAGGIAIGNLLVTRRFYTVAGERMVVPGHVGIITDSEPLQVIHASPSAGVVEERPLPTAATVMGGIALHFETGFNLGGIAGDT